MIGCLMVDSEARAFLRLGEVGCRSPARVAIPFHGSRRHMGNSNMGERRCQCACSRQPARNNRSKGDLRPSKNSVLSGYEGAVKDVWRAGIEIGHDKLCSKIMPLAKAEAACGDHDDVRWRCDSNIAKPGAFSINKTGGQQTR